MTFVTRKQVYDGHDEGSDKELDEILEQQHNINFKERYGELPFWRVVILHGAGNTAHFVACFIYHHVIGDGKSGLAFHRSFLSALSAIPDLASATTGSEASAPVNGDADNGHEADTIVYPPQTPLIPNLESLHPLPLSIPYILKALWDDWFPRAPRTLWTGGPISTAPSARRVRFRSVTLSQSTSAGLLAASRANSTTLTAAVEVLLAAAVLAHLPPERYSSVRCNCPVSLRRFLPSDIVDDDSIGTWVSRYEEVHHRLSGVSSSRNSISNNSNALELFSWEEARRVKATIDAELRKNGRNTAAGLLRYVRDSHRFFKKKVGKPREHSFELSNIGLFKPAVQQEGSKGEEEEGWRIGRMIFSQSADVVGAGFEACLVTGGDGRLTFGFSWLEGIVEGVWMEKVIEELKGMMEKMAQ